MGCFRVQVSEVVIMKDCAVDYYALFAFRKRDP